jgi:endonuclease/exonuclease/phosphatase family metal-dependent hydrolase
VPFYNNLDPKKGEDRWTAVGLLRLRRAIKKSVSEKKMDSNLLLATWNIREFGGKKFKPRTKEALFYLAEVISAFDLVAIQEVRSSLGDFNRLLQVLGNWWRYLLTDVTLGGPGNEERLAFLYDSRRVTFGGFASQLVLPPLRGEDGKRTPAEQLARTPFLVGFRSGWLKFTICTAHILYGKGIANHEKRVQEISKLAQFLAARVAHPDAWAKNMIVLGDFNIFNPKDATFSALQNAGFTIPACLQGMPSNVSGGKHFDQIAFIAPDLEDKIELSKAGVLNPFNTVIKDVPKDRGFYSNAAESTEYKTWRTYQLSDHLPMWIELQTDFSGRYLQQKMRESGPVPVQADETAPPATG